MNSQFIIPGIAGAAAGFIAGWVLSRLGMRYRYYRSLARERSEIASLVVQPLKDTLDRYDHHIQEMERARQNAYGGLSEQLRSLVQTQDVLQKETGNLARALRVPHVRGRWGEMTLKRVVELSGMSEYCDFTEQVSVTTADGLLRPDMVVSLPGQRRIVIDAKVPLASYLESLEAQSEPDRRKFLEDHARQVQIHIQKLAAKSYWASFQPSPEFVVLFIPGENFFSAALSQSPDIIAYGASRGVILATPTTLISLLKTISFGWRQESGISRAREIHQTACDLYERLSVMAGHFHRLGKDMERCVQSYNQCVGSYERRVTPVCEKLTTMGVATKDGKAPTTPDTIEKKPAIPEPRQEGSLPPGVTS